MAKIKLTLIDPTLDNTRDDLFQYLKSVETALKEEIYMTGGWQTLGYEKLEDFLEDNYYSLVSRIAKKLEAPPTGCLGKETTLEAPPTGCLGKETTLEAPPTGCLGKETTEVRDRLIKALALRQKVATYAGWSEFFITEVSQELWGKHPLSSQSVKIPHYEADFGQIRFLLASYNIDFERTNFADHITDELTKNEIYMNKDTRLFVSGETAAIALCNLFIAALDDR